MDIKDKIIQACCSSPKYESCGFVVYDDGEFNIIECENKAENKEEEFYIPAKTFLYAKKNYKIVAIYHSHPKSEEFPSDFDRANCESCCYSFLIFSNINRKFNIIEPEYNDSNPDHLKKLKERLNL
tara:strand:+ start:1348 stop:1725 length:378 start_codon:yes stop_codon:yes gene_type:complete